MQSSSHCAKTVIKQGSAMALRRANIGVHPEAYNHGGTITYGTDEFELEPCSNLEAFQEAFNKNKYLRAHWDGHRWTVKPKQEIFGSSDMVQNVYTRADGSGIAKKIEKRGSDYYLLDHVDLDLIEDYFHFDAGKLQDERDYKTISSANAITVSTIDQTHALSGSQFVFSKSNWGAGKPQSLEMDLARSTVSRKNQADRIYLEKGDVYITKPNFPGRFTIEMHGDSEGLIMQSPRFSIFRGDKLSSPYFSFRIRAGGLIDLKHCTVDVAFPTTTQRIFFEKNANKMEVWADTGLTKVRVLQGTLDIPTDARLGFVALDDQSLDASYQSTTQFSNTQKGSICLAIRTPTDMNYTIFESNLFKLSVANYVLVVNGVSTALSLAASADYSISASFDGTEIEASALNLGTAGLTQYASSSAEGTFVSQSSYANDFTALSTGGRLGTLVMVYDNSDLIEQKLLQQILADHWGQRVENLGTYSSITNAFSNGTASLADQKLTHSATIYDRICPDIDEELRAIFRLPENDIFAEEKSTKNGYVDRISGYNIRCTGVSLNGIDQSSLLYSGHSTSSLVDCAELDYCPFFHLGRCIVHASWIDAQDGSEREFSEIQPSSYTISIK